MFIFLINILRWDSDIKSTEGSSVHKIKAKLCYGLDRDWPARLHLLKSKYDLWLAKIPKSQDYF